MPFIRSMGNERLERALPISSASSLLSSTSSRKGLFCKASNTQDIQHKKMFECGFYQLLSQFEKLRRRLWPNRLSQRRSRPRTLVRSRTSKAYLRQNTARRVDNFTDFIAS